MKINIVVQIISGICLVIGCVFYLLHNKKEDDRKFGILYVIFTALGIGLFVGSTNMPSLLQNHTIQQYNDGNNFDNEEDINEEYYEFNNDIDP